MSGPPADAAVAAEPAVWSPSRDDTDEGWPAAPEGDHDEWLRRQRPPHWG